MIWRGASLRVALATGVVLGLCGPPGTAVAEDAKRDLGGATQGAPPDPDDLQDQIIEIRSLIGNTRIGGWVDFDFTYTDQEGKNPYFDAHHFYLYFDNRMNEKWQAFAELEAEHALQLGGGSDKGTFKVERLYIQYNHEEWLHLRGGKFNSRFGYWTPVHWAVNVDTIQAPIHEANAYVPRKSVGVEVFGSAFPTLGPVEDLEIHYSGWFSNGSEFAGTDKPMDGRFGGGADLRLLFDAKYLFGASWYRQSNPDSKIRTPGRTENSVMLYTDLMLPGRITLRAELMRQFRGGGDADVRVNYGKIRWHFLENAYLNYRFGYGDDDKSGRGGTHAEHIATLGYNPVPKVRIKLEYGRHDFKDPIVEGYNAYIAWVGYVF